MIDYRLVYELSTQSNDSGIFSSLLFYAFMVILWRVLMNGEFKKLGIALSVIYLFSVIDTAIDNASTPNIKSYKVAEGEVYDWVKASYYNRRDGSFVVNGVKFNINMRGIDKMFKTPLHFDNGRRVKIDYIEKNKIIRFWIENYSVILEQKCNRNNYTACFELSRRYQKKNRTKAQKLILKSTESNISNYSLMVSLLYKHGILFDKNSTKSELFYDKYAQKENAFWYRRKESISIDIPLSKEPRSDTFDILEVMD